jgi:hypothetical protein
MHLPAVDKVLRQTAEHSLACYHGRMVARLQAQLVQGPELSLSEPEVWMQSQPMIPSTTFQDVLVMNTLPMLPIAPELDREQTRWQGIEHLYQEDTLFRLSWDHFDQPVMVQAYASECAQLKLLEAWLRARLWVLYQLVLIAPTSEACPPAALQALLQLYPEARSYFAWLPLSSSRASELVAALPTFATTQEPHLYLVHEQEPCGPMVHQALQSGLLTFAPDGHALRVALPDATIQLQPQNWLSLANSLTRCLFAEEADWETRQAFVSQAQQAAQGLRPELTRRLPHSHLPLCRGA